MGDPTQQKSGKEAPGAEHHHGMTSEASDTHLKNVKSWFGTHAQQWSDSYTDVRRVKDRFDQSEEHRRRLDSWAPSGWRAHTRRLSLDVAADLWLLKEHTNYAALDYWVFASPRVKGKSSRRPDVVLTKVIQPAAVRAGIKKRIGWHTFRHTYATTLIANGENVKVVQELMRHANSRCTLDVYTQARISAKRDAQQRVVQMILSGEEEDSEIKLQRRGPDELLGGVG